MKTITVNQVMRMHEQLIDATGGTQGVRDPGLLASAIAAPFQSFMGCEAHPSLLEKAAYLGYGIIKNHPYLDGNKRSGVHAMLVFLALNGAQLQYTQKELSDMVVQVASGAMAAPQLHAWLEAHLA